MRAILLEVSEEELARRKRIGLDRWDEMWEGVLHMAPAPAFEHQRIQLELGAFLLPLLKRKMRGILAAGINVFGEKRPLDDYRIPDLSFVSAGSEKVIASDGIRGGAPGAMIEIHFPGDETYEKFPFFAALGVREVIVIHRDTKNPEVFRFHEGAYKAVRRDHEGWVPSEVLGVKFRLVEEGAPRLRIEDAEDPQTAALI